MLVKHVGVSDSWTISSKEWEAAGIEHDAVEFSAKTNHRQELTDEAAEHLLTNHPNDFKRVTEAQQAKLAEDDDDVIADDAKPKGRTAKAR